MMELMENQINFLKEECNLLENLFNHKNHQTKLNNDNTTLTPGEAGDDFQVVKDNPILNYLYQIDMNLLEIMIHLMER